MAGDRLGTVAVRRVRMLKPLTLLYDVYPQEDGSVIVRVPNLEKAFAGQEFISIPSGPGPHRLVMRQLEQPLGDDPFGLRPDSALSFFWDT